MGVEHQQGTWAHSKLCDTEGSVSHGDSDEGRTGAAAGPVCPV